MTDRGIAIVGMGCRFPDADSPTALFEHTIEGRTAFRPLPPSRLSPAYAGDDGDGTYLRRAAVLTGWTFPRADYGVSRTLYDAADHAHWLALQVADEALADAGFEGGAGIPRERAGVVLGNTLTGEFSRASTLRLRAPFLAGRLAAALERRGIDPDAAAGIVEDFTDDLRSHFPAPDDNSLAGALSNTIAGRICNHFDFHGLGFTVDGACSSSLLAVEIATRALRDGQLDVALAGGVDLSLDPFELVGFARLGALAHEEMRVYDARPTGFIPGEGCGVVVLMRADDAERTGRRTYARIDGVGVSSDGGGGLTRPVSEGQLLAHERAYEMAGYGPDSVELIEGHGTGTAVGDAVELDVLRRVRAGAPGAARLGSIKANIGHTKAAAGTAGLIKAALAVHHGVKPPNTGCERPHDVLVESRAILDVGHDVEEFRGDVPRASVSALGFGGINCTVLVGGDRRRPNRVRVRRLRARARRRPRHDVFVLGAASRHELRAEVDRIAELAGRLSEGELADLAPHLADAQDRRFRACAVAADPWELADALAAARELIDGWSGDLVVDRRSGVALGSGPAARVGLLFPGQAAPVRLDPPPWAAALGLSLDLPIGEVDASSATEVAQPAIVYQSLLGTAWIEAMECDATVAVGHSLGELSALSWAGMLSPAATLELAATRGRLMAEHGRAGTTMAGVAAAAEVVAELIEGSPLQIAGYNAPAQTVVAGPDGAVSELLADCATAGIPARELDVSHGFHSTAMAPAAAPFAAALRATRFSSPDETVLSTVTGAVVDTEVGVADRLEAQLTQPVRFEECIVAIADDVDLLVEVGPGEILGNLARACGFEGSVTTLDAGGDTRQIALAAAALVAGAAGRADHWFAGRPRRAVDPERSRLVLANPCEVEPAGTLASDAPGTGSAPTAPSEPPGVESGLTTAERVRRHIGRAMDLDPDALDPGSSLLADLHLTSLQAVEIAEALIEAAGKAPPLRPLPVATATIAELADLIEELPAADAGRPAVVAGVATWVRSYEHRWTPWQPGSDPGPARWRTVRVGPRSGDATPPPATAADPGPESARPSGVVMSIEPEATVADLASAVKVLVDDPPDRVLVASAGHGAATGVARALSAELEHVAVTSLTRPGPVTDDDLRCATGHGYLELRRGADGGLERPLTTVRPPRGGSAGDIPLRPDDVCLVTGGVGGISVECAVELAQRTGARIVALGRSGADTDRVRDGLERLPDDVDVRYLSCDLGDDEAVRACLTTARQVGPVRGLIHGAAINEPHRLGDLTEASLAAHVGPKVDGLRHLLDAAGDELALLVAFGSVIGRGGLEGEGAYCIANDWMRAAVETWAADHPGCRTRTVEWSVWSGTGMAVRLGVVDRLERAGVVPIPPEDGRVAFIDAIADESAPTTVTVTGRFPPSPRLWQHDLDRPLLHRFQEDLVHYAPGVELVVQPRIDLASDGYLADHRPGDVPLLPAVVGMEAMVQVAAGCRSDGEGDGTGWTIEDARFTAPITVADGPGTELQIASLADGGRVDVRIRSSSDGFAAERFGSTVVTPTVPPPAPIDVADVPAVPATVDGGPLYDATFFHGPRFRVVESFEHLSAYHIVVRLRDEGPEQWFSDFHSQDLLLGSPALNDGIIHALLATLPTRHAVPIGIDRVTFHRPAHGSLLVEATQVAADDDDFVFDVVAWAADGSVQSTWEALRVRSIGARAWDPGSLPAGLVGPWVSRRLDDIGWPWRVGIASGDDRLTADADVLVGIAGRPVDGDTPEQPPGRDGDRLAEVLTASHGFAPDVAAGFVVTARRALLELGDDADVPLDVKLREDDGVWLEGHRVAVAVLGVHPTGAAGPIPVAVAVAP